MYYLIVRKGLSLPFDDEGDFIHFRLRQEAVVQGKLLCIRCGCRSIRSIDNSVDHHRNTASLHPLAPLSCHSDSHRIQSFWRERKGTDTGWGRTALPLQSMGSPGTALPGNELFCSNPPKGHFSQAFSARFRRVPLLLHPYPYCQRG